VSATAAAQESFTGTKGRRIEWFAWAPDDGKPRAVVVIAHGFGEHSGRYAHVATRLTDNQDVVYALDHHGHGRSEGARGRIDLQDAVTDLDHLVTVTKTRHPDTPTFLLGHSMGGAIALRYAMQHQARLTGLILSGPLAAIAGRKATQTIGKLLGTVAPGLGLAKISPDEVSRDPAVVKAYAEDPLVFHGAIPAQTVAEFVRHVETLRQDAQQLTVPTLLMYGTADTLADPSGSKMLATTIKATDLTTTPYEGLYHEILNEPEQDQVMDEVVAWINARTATTAQ
jgi:acylglycerol lipase